jgi:sirohydrochlorin ferrochelatase
MINSLEKSVTPTGIIVFAHGSRIESANEAVRAVAAGLARTGTAGFVEAAFLELGQPDLPTAAARLAGLGVHCLVILPYFLTLGIHMERDLPRIADRISNTHKGLEIVIAPPLDGHPALLQILEDRARDALIRLSPMHSDKT